jgi:hypothetical protein
MPENMSLLYAARRRGIVPTDSARQNSFDRRSVLKRQINVLLGSVLVEEKAYTDWGQPGSVR